ncbi:MAG: hypothetical protein R6T98_03465 [Desulfatiglandales bacterium]
MTDTLEGSLSKQDWILCANPYTQLGYMLSNILRFFRHYDLTIRIGWKYISRFDR